MSFTSIYVWILSCILGLKRLIFYLTKLIFVKIFCDLDIKAYIRRRIQNNNTNA